MGQPNFARIERAELCDLFETVGPDQPTLCSGWTTRDLAAHLVVRDRRPDAAIGIMIKPLAGHTDNLRRAAAADDFHRLVDRLRRPPAWTLAGPSFIDRAINTGEFFIHHEDVRRGTPDWQPRNLPRGLQTALHSQLRLATRFRLRKFPASVTITSPGFPPITGGAGGPALTVSGDPGEHTLFFSGRQGAADVEIDGPPELAQKLRASHFAL